MTSLPRLVMCFLATVLSGIIATLVAPAFASAQTSPPTSGPASSIAHNTSATYARAVSAPLVTWSRAVATRALVRGDTLRADDFAVADTAIQGRLPYGLDTTTPRAGWLVQRAVSAGEWLRAPAVIPRPVVTAGRPVFALWSDGTVSLAVSAVALGNAPVGGAVSVRVGRNRRLSGIAIAPDSVRLR